MGPGAAAGGCCGAHCRRGGSKQPREQACANPRPHVSCTRACRLLPFQKETELGTREQSRKHGPEVWPFTNHDYRRIPDIPACAQVARAVCGQLPGFFLLARAHTGDPLSSVHRAHVETPRTQGIQSFRAIQSPDPKDDKQWLTFWLLFGMFDLVCNAPLLPRGQAVQPRGRLDVCT